MPGDEWKDQGLAERWSGDPTRSNPIRTEHLDILMAILADLYRPGQAILDLGYGSGLVEEMIFQRIPGAHIVGVDFSPAMMALARERLRPYGGQFTEVEHDLAEIETLVLPEKPYHFVFASQSLHHLTEDQMQRAYQFIYRTLEPDGWFILVDRTAVVTPALFDVYVSVWNRLARISGGENNDPMQGKTFDEHVRLVRESGDLPVSLEQHLIWLRETGFETACLHCHANRAVIVGRKVER